VLLLADLTIPGPWTRRRILPLALAHMVILLFLVGRLYGPGGLSEGGGYKTAFTLERLIDHGARFIGSYFYQRGPRSNATWMFAAVVVTALLARDRVPKIGVIIALVGILPVIFLQDRSMPAAYIPFAGWTLACAWTLEGIFRQVLRQRWAPAVPFLCLYWLLWTKSAKLQLDENDAHAEGRRIGAVLDDLRALHLKPPPGSRVLMLADPFPHMRYSSTFAWQIVEGDSTLGVDWVSERPDAKYSDYRAVLTTVDGRVRRVQ
jgi:hypothetical protein